MWHNLHRRSAVTALATQRSLHLLLVVVLASIAQGAIGPVASAAPASAVIAQTPPPDALPMLNTVSDRGGRFAFSVPATWSDSVEADWSLDSRVVGTQVTATPDLTAFYADWGVPGIITHYSDVLPATMTLAQVLDEVDLGTACDDGGREPFSTGALTGFIQHWERCGATATSGTVAALAPAGDPQFYAVLEIYTTAAADQPVIDRIIGSFVAPTNVAPTTDQVQLQATPVAPSAPPSRPGLTYTFASRRDPAVVALLPQEFDDVVSEPWLAATGQPVGHMVAAAPDLAAFRSTWTTPGIVVRTALGVTRTLDAATLLADSDLRAACTAVERSERVHASPDFTYNIVMDTYRACGGAATYVLAVAQSEPADHLFFVEFQATSAADRAALDIFFDSFALERTAIAAGGTADTTSASSPTDAASATVAASAATPAPISEPTPLPPVQPTGVVLANNLNVRGGPGTDFERLGAAPRGTTLPVQGQFENCAWLRVTAPNNLVGWVSGDPQFITLDTPCAQIPPVQP